MKKQFIIILSAIILIATVIFAVQFIQSSNSTQKIETATSSTNTETETETNVNTCAVPTDSLTKEQTDLPYATVSETQKLDIFLPDSQTTAVPVVLNIHGGAFKIGDKAGMGAFGGGGPGKVNTASTSSESPSKTAILNHGFAYASMNYRLSGEAIFPAAINDVKAAIRYLKANACELGIDANNIVLYGQSAGGNLAALAGVSGEINSFNDEKLGNEQFDSSVQAVVDFYGPINFLTMDSDFAELGVNGNQASVSSSPESQYIGQNITDAPDLVAKSNPETYITSDDPAFFVQAGSEDTNVPYLQGKKLTEKLSLAIPTEKVYWELLEGAGHGGAAFETAENLAKMLQWIDEQLR